MRIAIVAPSAVPFAIGGAEKLWWGLQAHLNQETAHQAELIKLPSPEQGLWELVASYRAFAALDLSHFDVVLSTKYPAWMVRHPRHVCYLQHRLRGLYDTYAMTGLPLACESDDPRVADWLSFARASAGRREALDEGFERLAALRDAGVPGLDRFPGPFARAVVHWLDGIGLAPSAIQRWAAISRNVAGRAGYFPPGTKVRVLPHPSDLRGLREGASEHWFTAARLDHVKRIDLLIRALRLAKTELPLRIAGTGPDAGKLRELAAGDPRVELLGFVTDTEMERLYADAFGVLYAPWDEDYGLVPIEAMACAKPVVTTLDAGGPLEHVVDGENGLVVEPSPERLAEAIDWLAQNPARARAMGLAGREHARGVTWERVVEGLLDEPPRRARAAARGKPRIVVAMSYPAFPPQGGGQLRAFELYRRLARDLDVEIVSLGRHADDALEAEIAPGLVERRVPPSAAHLYAEQELSRLLDWLPVTDIALPRFHVETPAFGAALRAATARADAVVACHPYVLTALDAARPDAPLWYEAQDVELDLKASVLPAADQGLLDDVRRVEAACCARAEQVWVCSREDGERLTALHGLTPERIVVVPNGVDVEAVAFVAPAERARRQAALGLDASFTAVFIGSWHPPNLDAVRAILALAAAEPAVNFVVMGGAGNSFLEEPRPANVALLGVVDPEVKALALSVADLALNPIESGSGTNLKMLEYAAAGVPILTTPHGARGLSFRDGEHLRIAALADWPAALEAARVERGSAAGRDRCEAARAWAEAHYAWDGIVERLFRVLPLTDRR